MENYGKWALLLGFVSFSAQSALGIADYKGANESVETKRDEKMADGWSYKDDVGGSLSFGSSQDVIGQTDGDSTTLGLNLLGGANYRSKKLESKNSLKLKAATTKTPTIPRYIKSNDELRLDSRQLYFPDGWTKWGPYAKVTVVTTAFEGRDEQTEEKDYVITRRDGTVENETATSLKLTDALKPVTSRETIGILGKIKETKTFVFETYFGLGAIQVDAKGQLIVKDDADTDTVEVIELQSYSQAGLEAGFKVEGQLSESSTYSFEVDTLTPFVYDKNAVGDKSGTELMNVEAKAKLTSKATSWLGLSFEASYVKQPQLADVDQIQTLMVMNFTYSVF